MHRNSFRPYGALSFFDSHFYTDTIPTGFKRVLKTSRVCVKSGAVTNSTIGVNLAILHDILWDISTNAAPTGLRSVGLRFSTEIPSLRDSRGFWSFQGFRVESGAVTNRTYRTWGNRRRCGSGFDTKSHRLTAYATKKNRAVDPGVRRSIFG